VRLGPRVYVLKGMVVGFYGKVNPTDKKAKENSVVARPAV